MAGVLYEAEYNGRKLVVTQSHAGYVAFMTYRVTRDEAGAATVSDASGYVATPEEAQALYAALGEALHP